MDNPINFQIFLKNNVQVRFSPSHKSRGSKENPGCGPQTHANPGLFEGEGAYQAPH